ncbi:MAG: hypothetical protein H6Q41_5842, partial [Deltaproteobacteria bacterium]|nr:hypothetical protein [Deltaproteobacteria bacterium]
FAPPATIPIRGEAGVGTGQRTSPEDSSGVERGGEGGKGSPEGDPRENPSGEDRSGFCSCAASGEKGIGIERKTRTASRDEIADADDEGSGRGSPEGDPETGHQGNSKGGPERNFGTGCPRETSVQVAKEVPKEVPKDIPREVPKEAPKEVAKVIPKEVAKEVPKEVPRVIPKEIPKEAPKEVPKEVAREVPVEVPKEVTKEIAKEVPKEVPKEIPKQVAREIPKEPPKEVVKEVPKEPPKDVSAVTLHPGENLTIWTKGGRVASSRPSLLAKEEEVKQFFSSYVDRYHRRDVGGFLSLFSSRAIQNQTDRSEAIRSFYTKLFDQSQELRCQIEGMKIEISQYRVDVKGRFRVDQKLKKDGEDKVLKGNIRWVLVKEEGRLKISSIDYKNEKSP